MKPARPQWLPFAGDVPGLALAALVGGGALVLSRVLPKSPFLSDMLIALVAGALILNTGLARLVGLSRPGAERMPDRYAAGLRYVGKWVLRLAIVLMGLKVSASAFSRGDAALMAGAIAAGLPCAFLVAHATGAWLGMRRPLVDLLACGTMICGASAVNAAAPVAGAHRGEQGIATGAVFVYSIVAMLAYPAVAGLVGLDGAHAGLWSGLAVNDLSSAVAVGTEVGGAVTATAAKSLRVLLLAPLLFVLAVLRAGRPRPGDADGAGAPLVPRYLLGYVALATLRILGDGLLGGSAAWTALLQTNGVAIDLLLAGVAAGIGLHLEVGTLLRSGLRALVVAGAAWLSLSAVVLGMVAAAARGAHAAAALVGLSGLVVAYTLWRMAGGAGATLRQVEERFARGLPLSLGEATALLHRREPDEETRRRLMRQLHPSIGELIPARESPFVHGDGSRWLTYWLGESGWALVAVVREAGSTTPIHAHPHRLLARTIEGSVEELRFREVEAGVVELVERRRVGHDELVETEGPSTIHAIRALGERAAIDLQLRGPEAGAPGLRLDTSADLGALAVGDRVVVAARSDDRPGHGGEGPAAAISDRL